MRSVAVWLVFVAGCATKAGTTQSPIERTPEQTEETALASLVLRDTAPPRDPTNRYADDPAAAALGHRFFFDPGFSGALLSSDNDVVGGTLGRRGARGKVSCEGCHIAKDGFSDTRTFSKRISLAANWVLRRTPSLLDVAQASLIMWDGRRSSLFGQAINPVESADEFNGSRLFLAQEIARRYRAEYEAIFGAVGDLGPEMDASLNGCTMESTGRPFEPRSPKARGCHGMPGDEAEYDALTEGQKTAVDRVAANFGKALGAYQRKLTCGRSRFDEWMDGSTTALTEEEIAGARLFVGRARCVECHSGPYLSDQGFHNVGLRPERVTNFLIDENDPGAAEGFPDAVRDPFSAAGPHSDDPIAGAERLPDDPNAATLAGAFRTPTLRCVARRPSFMHTGQFTTLKSVVEFFNRGGDEKGFPGVKEIAPLGLTEDEVNAIVAFLGALDGPGPDARWMETPR